MPKFVIPKINLFKTPAQNSDIILLLFAAAVMLLMMLGSNALWNVESRWAAVCLQMQLRGDYFHPYIYSGIYYDKPLLSYWLVLGVAKILGGLSALALRLPSAIAGVVAVYCTYRLGTKLVDRKVGLIAGWLLVSTYCFVFWARTISADMLNLAGMMLAVLWYFEHKKTPGFKAYFGFFLIAALTSLCKGLLGLVLPALLILPDLLHAQEWRKHLRWEFLAAFLLGAIIYALPFALSAYLPDQSAVHDSGFKEVLRENVQRFFQPFDHKDPIYTYFIYLPLYASPWILLFIPALVSAFKRWKSLDFSQRWFFYATGIVFLFLTLSGSRRPYYVLPLVPFVMLITANWLIGRSDKFIGWVRKFGIGVGVILFVWFGVALPIYNAQNNQLQQFVAKAQTVLQNKQFLVFGGGDSSAIFYLRPKLPVAGITKDELELAIIKHNLAGKVVIAQKDEVKFLADLIRGDKKYAEIRGEISSGKPVIAVVQK